jgi:hypothetical protein
VQQITQYTGVTIAIVKRPQDWQRITHMQQYHLPIRYIPHIMQSPWIAWYMPRWHTIQPHSIHYVAHMKAMTITPRQAYLPHEAAHPRANNLYAVLTFDAIYTLRAPIISIRWRRIGIHYTTWGALVRTNDLGALSQVHQRMHAYAPGIIDSDELCDLFESDISLNNISSNAT